MRLFRPRNGRTWYRSIDDWQPVRYWGPTIVAGFSLIGITAGLCPVGWIRIVGGLTIAIGVVLLWIEAR